MIVALIGLRSAERYTIGMMRFALVGVLALTVTAQRAPLVLVGATAPVFTIADDQGTDRSLGTYRGKYVVLEWHEKGCPYVNKHYKTGHMQQLHKTWMDRGVVWLGIADPALRARSSTSADTEGFGRLAACAASALRASTSSREAANAGW